MPQSLLNSVRDCAVYLLTRGNSTYTGPSLLLGAFGEARNAHGARPLSNSRGESGARVGDVESAELALAFLGRFDAATECYEGGQACPVPNYPYAKLGRTSKLYPAREPPVTPLPLLAYATRLGHPTGAAGDDSEV